ncbi:hypothetical protein, partial [Variovorax paradoxus]|uniref:hypothetical protein n=1 Tax=Variovorax paradoxus TaxID=34073 RepID=UPI001C10BC19
MTAAQLGKIMAFDLCLNTAALAADINAIAEQYLHASLMASAVACLALHEAEWWSLVPGVNYFERPASIILSGAVEQ